MQYTTWTKKHSLDLFLLSILAASATQAFSYDIKHEVTHGHGILQLGGYWNNFGSAQHINIDGLIGDNFSNPHTSSGSGLVGVGYFINGQDNDLIKMTYGLNWFYLGPNSATGTVTQENLYTNLGYSYKVTHYPLYAVAKSTFNTKSPNYGVTLDAGIGPNFMVTSNFQEQSLDGMTIPDQIFAGKTNTIFSATVGIGIKFNQFFDKVPLECGYRFYYLGQGNFKTLTDQVVNTLNTGVNYSNAVMCAFTI